LSITVIVLFTILTTVIAWVSLQTYEIPVRFDKMATEIECRFNSGISGVEKRLEKKIEEIWISRGKQEKRVNKRIDTIKLDLKIIEKRFYDHNFLEKEKPTK